MEEVILIERGVALYLNRLIDILIEKEYLGFYETAEQYVNKIYDFIYNKLPSTHFKETKSEYARLGKYYSMYKANKRTSWVVFFEINKGRILITHITNNHTEEYAKIID
ncbi:MAG: hypothetical protein J0L67_13450 [Cytophagales bacterium]|nr:hypothetical protein [Cytophagales bacterium]